MWSNSILKRALYSRYFHYFLLWMRRLRIKRNYMIYRWSGWALNWSPGPQSPPEPHVSAARPQSCHMQWTFIHHTLTPMHQRLTSIAFPISRIHIQKSSSSSRIWAIAAPEREGEPSLAWGEHLWGIFSVCSPWCHSLLSGSTFYTQPPARGPED